VHLIREAVRGNREHDHSQTLSVLLSRCKENLRSKVAPNLPNAAEVRSTVLGEFSLLLAEDASHLTRRKPVFEQAVLQVLGRRIYCTDDSTH